MVAGELSTLPYPAAQATLEEMFGEPVARLLGPPYGLGARALPVVQRIHGVVTSVEHVRTALSALTDPGREATDLAAAIDGWSAERRTRPE